MPPYFAMRLSFPERVTPHNVEQLRQVHLRRFVIVTLTLA